MPKDNKITGKEPIAEIITKYPETVDIFFKHGLYCVGCPASYGESLEQGAKAHGINLKNLLKDLNKVIEKK
jgi:hybrid cluster-associated redox disulfide protein